ncbi:high frequency lysogenization protein HflD [uncultured Paraglaciecola sp.]|uniref:high frequency lysogenization protein HflD n=1 Tax=uncultured Paraglaciecola sp. TaxID=1765024 RepID=UPI00261E0E23|nr:high frequency lysogenization protein HflD [uncultured Paraglaciecola sp.]
MSSNKHRFYESNIALAGLCQAASLVKHIARGKEFDHQALVTSTNSVIITDSENTEQVFGDLGQIVLGYKTLLAQLNNESTKKDVEVTRYIANLLSIERKLSANKKMMASLGERISNIQRQQLHLDQTDSQLQSNLASIYTDLISPESRKIQVAGVPAILQRPDNQHKVRALLLAGIRAAVLWRQLGGKRRHILFNRQQILDSAEHTLHHLNMPI